ncbi:hypothetical protein MN116_008373 [Schistosoma mekongi]|uniref:Sodium/hydrogen exchanger n=1 Tax=Schistosoma mekongi TaxID=38744 RepID=A0AAE1Z617_SCHME|nr:hypothetical protein MN116_008373 [Schistosoma mekongi]
MITRVCIPTLTNHLSLFIILLILFNHIRFIQLSSIQEEIVVAKWKFNEFEIHITVMLFLLAVILIKIAYHHIPYVSSYVPESFILILIGILFGVIVRYGIDQGSDKITSWKLTPELFFNYLLPPIILESAYGLYNRTFSEYLGTVMLFAVLGTVFNFLIIGFLLYGLYIGGAFGYPEITLDLSSFLLFSSLIVAIDPVAVLAIFHDIGLELNLYYIVFGESLLNDAITVVLYEIMIAFTGKEIVTISQIGIGIASFFTVSFGGLFIGIIFGILACLITRLRSHLAVFTMLLLAYFSYIMADCIGWSGIISMIGCGLIQTAYAFHNVDTQTKITVHNFVRVVAEISESVIFLFLGIGLISETLKWHTGYILWSLIICLISRGIVVLIMTAIVNLINVDDTKITLSEQTVLIYGGLRGAVAFSLAILISPNILGRNGNEIQSLIVTTTLFIILFTVGIMGITIKPLVKLLNIRMEYKHTLSLFNALNTSVLDEMLSVIEIIINCKRRNVIREFIKHIDEKYFRRILQNNPEYYNEKLFKIYEKISLCLHYVAMHPNQSKCLLTDLPESVIYKYLTNQLTPMPINIYSNNNNNNSNNNNNITINDVLNSYPIDINNNHETDKHVKKRKYQFHNHSNKILTQNKQLEESNVNMQTSTSNNQRRNIRRHAILPMHTKQQTDFNNKFLNILSLRNRELMMKIRNQSLEKLSLPQSSMTSISTIPIVTPVNISTTSIQMNEMSSITDNVINNEMHENQQQQRSLQDVIKDKRHKNHLH